MGRLLIVAIVVISISQVSMAGDQIRPLWVELVPNFNTCSVYAYFDGDDNGNATVTLQYRAGGEKAFRPGHSLSRTGKGRFSGSIFALEPDQPLEVRLVFDDPDIPPQISAWKKVLSAKTRTHSEKFPVGMGKDYYVSVKGKDANPGTLKKPFGTIQHAADLVKPGDTIYLLPGDYRQSVTIRRSGSPQAYIRLRSVPRHKLLQIHGIHKRSGERLTEHETQLLLKPRMRGDYEVRTKWRRVAEGVFVADEKRAVGTMVSGRRMYHHRSLEALKIATGPLLMGWWQDKKAGRLYVKVPQDRPPGPSQIAIGVLPFALRFQDCGYWNVEGLSFYLFGGGPYSRGIEINNSHNIVVRRCRFQYMRTGIAIRKAGSHHCLISGNGFVDDGIWTWPWKACKGHDVEGSAVSLRGGRGNVVRYNRIEGFFNGIVPGTWGDLENEAFNRDMDIHNNNFTEIADDPLEPEGACMNVRFWNNTTRKTLQGISLAPITVGPVYVIRDRYLDFKGGAVKVAVRSRGPVFIYHVLGWTNRPKNNAMAASGPWDNIHFRNCILRGTRYVIEDYFKHPAGCSFDYCCFFSTDRQFIKWANKRYWNVKELTRASGFGRSILRFEPYQNGPIDDNGQAGKLAPKLIDAGVRIPGINDDFKGAAPDIGPDEIR